MTKDSIGKNLKNFIGLILTIIIFNCSSQNHAYTEFNNDNWEGDKFVGFNNYKSVVGNKFMISTSEKIASEVGAEILEKGGNAIDSAIATQMVLNVIEPHSSGIGGGLFLLYYDKKNNKSIYFNGRETAPKNSFAEMFLDENGKARNFIEVAGSPLSVATPGALHALKKAHQKYGKIKWAKLFEPAIKIAKNGYPISKKMFVHLDSMPHLSKSESLRIYFEQNGKPKKVGTIIHNYQLAKTLETIANQGIKAFYSGKIAKDIENAVINAKENRGYLTSVDLKNYKSKTGNLICAKYRQKYKICSMPLPSSGGITILQTLGILENFDLKSLKPNSLEAVHLIAESLKLSYADRNKFLGDTKNVPVTKLLDKNYLKERAQLINLKFANDNVKHGNLNNNFTTKKIYPTQEKPSTTHISIVDKYGNAVSMTSSIELQFGSAIMVDGFLLNNQMTDFAFAPYRDGEAVANRVEPLKQPLSSMSPTFVFDDNNKLILTLGSPNGPRIIQHVLKTIIATLDWNMDIQEAVSLPNFIALNGIIELEKDTEITSLKKALQKIGHQVKITHITSAIQAIKIANNKIYGAADPRRMGVAIGK